MFIFNVQEAGITKSNYKFNRKLIIQNLIQNLAKKLTRTLINPRTIHAYTACRLVPLDKKPGVRPVGVGEVLRRIIGKAITTILKQDIVNATAPIQVCSGLSGGAEAAIHALRKIYDDPKTEAVILVDADNAFNSLNRNAALRNIQCTCPQFASYLINTYRKPAKLHISQSDEILYSEEGVTQGDNSAMGYYSCSLMPLLSCITTPDQQPLKNPKQIWYADDAAAGGKLAEIKRWWSSLCEHGPLFGYHPKPSKTWIIAKPGKLEEAKAMFPGLQVTDVGHKYLGSYIGTDEGKKVLSRTRLKNGPVILICWQI